MPNKEEAMAKYFLVIDTDDPVARWILAAFTGAAITNVVWVACFLIWG